MPDLAHLFIREPETTTPEEYHERVNRLAAAFLLLFCLSVAGIALLLWQAQHFVTLSQRSNVETLVLAFLLVFFVYFVVLSFTGARGALMVLWYSFQTWRSGDTEAVEPDWDRMGLDDPFTEDDRDRLDRELALDEEPLYGAARS